MTMYSPEEIARCCTSALLLELATTPKPGLVDRNSAPEPYSQFIASAVSLYSHFRQAAAGASVGRVVVRAAEDMMKIQTGGNTHLGALLLLTPLAKAAARTEKFSELRPTVLTVLEKMNSVDMALILQAVRAVNPGGLGRVAFLDVKSPRTRKIVLKRRLSVLDGFSPYRRMEVVAHEYTTGYEASFVHGYLYLRRRLQHEDWNTAGVNTFLNILSHLPDSHISRRFGPATSRMISGLAKRVLDSGGYTTDEGRKNYEQFAQRIKAAGFKPAATADLLAVSYMILLLSGWRP
ncbi:MAG: triphosphoribosyl-dephospho-CoA synthase [Candidatus Caldarchaeum sp.]|nr:triphosphoribosyl-dephospho-CoA synthase [Candidatus Caldarchaeum sp.]